MRGNRAALRRLFQGSAGQADQLMKEDDQILIGLVGVDHSLISRSARRLRSHPMSKTRIPGLESCVGPWQSLLRFLSDANSDTSFRLLA
jgi:hypothetical protein